MDIEKKLIPLLKGGSKLNSSYLLTFWLVKRYRSLVKASEVMEINKSGITKNLNSLETALDCILLDRRTVTLTDDGESLFSIISNFFSNLDNFTNATGLYGKNKITILGNEAVLDFLIIPKIKNLTEALEGKVNFQLESHPASSIVEQIKNGKGDCGLVDSLGCSIPETLKSEEIINVSYYLKIRKSLITDSNEFFNKIKKFPLALIRNNDFLNNKILHFLENKDKEMTQNICYCSSNGQILSLIDQGYYSFLPGIDNHFLNKEDFFSKEIKDLGKFKISLIYKENELWRRNLAGTSKPLMNEFLKAFRENF